MYNGNVLQGMKGDDGDIGASGDNGDPGLTGEIVRVTTLLPLHIPKEEMVGWECHQPYPFREPGSTHSYASMR